MGETQVVEDSMTPSPKDAAKCAGDQGGQKIQRLGPLASPRSDALEDTELGPTIQPQTPHPVRAQAVEAALNRSVTIGTLQGTPSEAGNATTTEKSIKPEELALQDAPMQEAELDTLEDPDGPSAAVIAEKREARKRYARFKRSIESATAELPVLWLCDQP